MVFEEGKNELKIQKSQQIGAKGANPCYFWAGPAECAGRAEALEFVKSLHSVSHACAPQRGRRIQSARRAFRRALGKFYRWVASFLSFAARWGDGKSIENY